MKSKARKALIVVAAVLLPGGLVALAAWGIIARLTLLKEEAFRIGMYRTGQKLEEPIKEAGWELADLLEHGDIE